MLLRDQRMVDATIQGNLLNGVAFFATTALLAVGGSLAMLGATDAAVAVLAKLPWIRPSNETQWEVKVLTLGVIFIYAFFKFAWAFRLYNYGSVMIGAAPAKTSLDAEALLYAERATRINVLAARHFNRGIRAYFFALATLGWFVNPYVFMGGVALVILVLMGREFATRQVLEQGGGIDLSDKGRGR